MELQANAANPNPTLELCSTKGVCHVEQGDVPDCAQTLQKTWTCLSALLRTHHRNEKEATLLTTSTTAG